MFETAVDYIEEYVLQEQLTGEVPRYGNRDPRFAPQGVYRCAGDDNWLALSVRNDAEWRALCELLPQLDAEWLHEQRTLHHDRI